jgi:hypothetical protein
VNLIYVYITNVHERVNAIYTCTHKLSKPSLLIYITNVCERVNSIYTCTRKLSLLNLCKLNLHKPSKLSLHIYNQCA